MKTLGIQTNSRPIYPIGGGLKSRAEGETLKSGKTDKLKWRRPDESAIAVAMLRR
jgi:hypothetical protein